MRLLKSTVLGAGTQEVKMRYEMTWWILIIILLLPMRVLLPAGQQAQAAGKPAVVQKTIQIGMLKFSRKVFDKEIKQMGARFTHLEAILDKRFGVSHYFHDEVVSFAEIEDPANMIDKAMSRNTPAKLEELCRQKNLDGIIFGHFQQEDRMIVVFRFYFSRAFARMRGITGPNRMKSFRKTIKLKKLGPVQVKKVTDKLSEQLEIAIFGKKLPKKPEPLLTSITAAASPAKTPPPPPLLQPLYVAQLSFLDAKTLSISPPSSEMAIIIDAFANALTRELTGIQKRWGKQVIVNKRGYIIPNTTESANNLVNVVFDPNLTRNDRIQRIIAEMMVPHHVDVIVSGHYIDNPRNPMIIIRPLLIIKSSRRVITRNLQFKKNQLICTGQDGHLTVCKRGLNIINEAAKEFMEQIHR